MKPSMTSVLEVAERTRFWSISAAGRGQVRGHWHAGLQPSRCHLPAPPAPTNITWHSPPGIVSGSPSTR